MVLGDIGATFVQGIIVGFAVAAPVGPIGILCIRRTLAQGPATGLASGAGAATADAVYGIIAALGVGALTTFLVGNAWVLKIGGGILMLWLGWGALKKVFHSPANTSHYTDVGHSVRGLATDFGSTFALTVTNPMTILAFVGMMGAIINQNSQENATLSGLALVSGVFTGSIAWWSLLVTVVTLARKSISASVMRIIDIASGLLLVAFGIFAILGGTSLI